MYLLAKRDFLPVNPYYILEMPKSLAIFLAWIVCQKLHLITMKEEWIWTMYVEIVLMHKKKMEK